MQLNQTVKVCLKRMRLTEVMKSLHRKEYRNLLGEGEPHRTATIGSRIEPNRAVAEEGHGESELTRKLCNNWDALEVHDDLVYRKFVSKRSGEPNVLQLLVPRCQVAEILRAGTVNEHFSIKQTLDQVQRRFYWSTWKSDTERYCRHCEQCVTYHRGKLRREGEIKDIYESFVEMIRSRMTDAYSKVRNTLKCSAKRNKRYYDCKVRPQNCWTVDLLLQPTKVSRETDKMDVPIQWAIPSYADTITSDSGHSEKPKGEAVCCSY